MPACWTWHLLRKHIRTRKNARIESRFATIYLGSLQQSTTSEIIMAVTYAWGTWKEDWPKGRFRCVFVESQSQPDGMFHATGLYRAVDGDTLYNIDTFRETIAERAAVIIDGSGGVLVRTEFAELLTLMPAFLQELKERLGDTDEFASSDGNSRYTLVTRQPIRHRLGKLA
jgi:hypothetical protein